MGSRIQNCVKKDRPQIHMRKKGLTPNSHGGNMKQNKILKILSYIILSISIATMILSAISFGFKNSTRYDKDTYFSSETFAYDYITTIINIFCINI